MSSFPALFNGAASQSSPSASTTTAFPASSEASSAFSVFHTVQSSTSSKSFSSSSMSSTSPHMASVLLKIRLGYCFECQNALQIATESDGKEASQFFITRNAGSSDESALHFCSEKCREIYIKKASVKEGSSSSYHALTTAPASASLASESSDKKPLKILAIAACLTSGDRSSWGQASHKEEQQEAASIYDEILNSNDLEKSEQLVVQFYKQHPYTDLKHSYFQDAIKTRILSQNSVCSCSSSQTCTHLADAVTRAVSKTNHIFKKCALLSCENRVELISDERGLHGEHGLRITRVVLEEQSVREEIEDIYFCSKIHKNSFRELRKQRNASESTGL